MVETEKTDQVIRAVLQAAREQEIGALLKTILHKFVYLVDLYEAEQSSGHTFSGAEWRFLHFGPFSSNVAERIVKLIDQREIDLVEGTRSSDDAAYEVYSLSRPAPSLKDIGISAHTRIHIASDLKRHARNLSSLLDYVYFRTTPMVDAMPGEVLTFESCRKRSVSDYKPVELKKLSAADIKLGRQKLAALANKTKQQIEVGPFDEVYYEGMKILDDPDLPVGLRGFARIKN